ncbi:hypothetical protein Pst134EA_009123 [Puccinia striiformis f. sp. tritici]|uniref:hypothetical protein n=1 Tax=Puccinia striiformis f. sp. tritici TaxID=168172 RepID=UPI002007B58C|nr:hypothetical protein Pst134EA_009123 [Puccinia striiformis f. sp. tritici]KAH9468588.1 hypothetical protein Pst134EA_009123 [Puccinia striiformis f. sp. tritici]
MASSDRFYLFIGLLVMIATNAMDELPWNPDPGHIWDFAVESPPWGDSIDVYPDVRHFNQHVEEFPLESISSQEFQTHQPVDSLTDSQRSKFPQDHMVPSTVNHHGSFLSPLSGQATDANPWHTLSNPQPENFPQAHTESLTSESQVPSHLNLPTNQATSAVLPINPGKAQISGGSGISLASKGVEKIPRRRDYDSSAFGWLRPSSTQRKAVRPERRPMNMPSASAQGDSNVPKANDGHNKNLEPARQEEIFTDPFQAGLNAAAHAIFSKPNSRLPKFDTPETLSPSAPIKKPRIAQPVRHEMRFTDSFQAGLDAAMQEMFSKRINTVASNANLPKVHPPKHFSSSHPVNKPRVTKPVRQEQTFTDPFQAGLDAAAQEIFGKRMDAVATDSKIPKINPPEAFSSSPPVKRPRIAEPVRQKMPLIAEPFQEGLNGAAQEIFSKRIETVATSSNFPMVSPPETASLSHPLDKQVSTEPAAMDMPSTTSFQKGLDLALQDIFSKRIDAAATNARLPKVHRPENVDTSRPIKKPRIAEPGTQDKPLIDSPQAGLNTATQETSSKGIETVATSTNPQKVYHPETLNLLHPVEKRRTIGRVTQGKPFTDSFQAGLDVASQDMSSKRISYVPTRSKFLKYYPSETSSPSYAVKKPVITENDPKFYSRKVRFDRDLFIDENASEEHQRNIDKILRVLDWTPGKKFLVTQERDFARRLETYASINEEITSSKTGQKRRRLDRGPRYTWILRKRRQLFAHKDLWYKYWKAQTEIDFEKSFVDQIENRQFRDAFPSFLFYIEIIMTVVRGNQAPVGSLKQKKEQLLKNPKNDKLFKFDLDPPTNPTERYYNKQKKIKDFMEKMDLKEPEITERNQSDFISKIDYTNGLITASELYLELIRYLECYVMKGKMGEDNPFKEETKVLKSAFDGSKLSYNFTIWVFLELWIKIYRPVLWVQMLDSRGRRIVDTAKSFINDVFCYAIDKLNRRYEELMENEESRSI